MQRQRLLLLRDHLRIRGERVNRIRIGNEGRGVRRLLLRVELGECIRLGIIMHCSSNKERYNILRRWKRPRQGLVSFLAPHSTSKIDVSESIIVS